MGCNPQTPAEQEHIEPTAEEKKKLEDAAAKKKADEDAAAKKKAEAEAAAKLKTGAPEEKQNEGSQVPAPEVEQRRVLVKPPS